MGESEIRNPFRSEADAFRVLMIAAVCGAVLIAAGLLVGSWLGLVLGGIMAAFAARSVVGWLRAALRPPD